MDSAGTSLHRIQETWPCMQPYGITPVVAWTLAWKTRSLSLQLHLQYIISCIDMVWTHSQYKGGLQLSTQSLLDLPQKPCNVLHNVATGRENISEFVLSKEFLVTTKNMIGQVNKKLFIWSLRQTKVVLSRVRQDYICI